MTTLIKYVNKQDAFSFVNIKEDDSFVCVGDIQPTEAELEDMVAWYDVSGWEIQDV